ncbi:hydrogenase maturation nickel metallochaperone HypA [Streptomyces sp. LP05-1]|uniref:Hydrogenase maturation factor HypA n=1 Tax=Streptomyces pyxinae TaxID=2970734 RepID=A0ABT2CQZ2_9ACTN|nr:hydrogenase maturation nickel metallochaperone HypA [Streptomyces sp. LP05-1]MCS0639512.1 hydrogenase maturation nickel metallochaperone HypA [Streptomyces sp. LP05-1]
MHELSIAVEAVARIEEALDRRERSGADDGTGRVTGVTLRIGELAGVVPDALRFAFDIATESTRLAGARLEIETVRGLGRCPACGRTEPTGLPPLLWCEPCGTAREVLAGRELEIACVELAGPAVAAGAADGAREPGDPIREANHVPHR